MDAIRARKVAAFRIGKSRGNQITAPLLIVLVVVEKADKISLTVKKRESKQAYQVRDGRGFRSTLLNVGLGLRFGDGWWWLWWMEEEK